MSNVLGKTREMDMCTGPLFKKILVFTFPIMLSNLLQILFNMADSVVVSRFSSDGSDALAAVGTTTSIIYLVINLAIGLSVGTNVLVSRYYGAKDYRRLGDAVHTSVFISLFTGLLCSVIGIFLTPALLRIVGAPEDILPLAAKYMKIYFAGFTAVSVYNFGSAILRAVGDTQRPLLYMLISGILNVTLNLFFVIVLDMSVDGVALATVISQGVAAVMVLITLMRTDSCYKLELKKIRCDWKSLKQIAIVGIPAGIQSSLFSISNAMVQSSINSFGKAVTAGNTAACNVENISYTALNSIQFAALAFTSQNIGAGKTDMVKKVLQKCIILNLILGVMIFTLVSLTGEYLLRIYDVQGSRRYLPGSRHSRRCTDPLQIRYKPWHVLQPDGDFRGDAPRVRLLHPADDRHSDRLLRTAYSVAGIHPAAEPHAGYGLYHLSDLLGYDNDRTYHLLSDCIPEAETPAHAGSRISNIWNI